MTSLFQRSATLSSCILFLEPLGPQSGAKEILTPALSAARTSVVLPYNSRFESGDHTKLEPTAPMDWNCDGVSAVP